VTHVVYFGIATLLMLLFLILMTHNAAPLSSNLLKM